MGLENSAATGVANVKPKKKFIRAVALVLLVIDFGSFGVFLYNSMFNRTGAVIFAERKSTADDVFWPSFVKELREFDERGYPFVGTVMQVYKEVRPKCGLVADYLTQKTLRFCAVGYYFIAGILILAFVAAEAFVSRARKKLEFKNISSTKYHLSLRAGLGTSFALVLLYIFLPAGNSLFGFAFPDTAGPFWLADPALWACLIVAGTGAALYCIISNLPSDI